METALNTHTVRPRQIPSLPVIHVGSGQPTQHQEIRGVAKNPDLLVAQLVSLSETSAQHPLRSTLVSLWHDVVTAYTEYAAYSGPAATINRSRTGGETSFVPIDVYNQRLARHYFAAMEDLLWGLRDERVTAVTMNGKKGTYDYGQLLNDDRLRQQVIGISIDFYPEKDIFMRGKNFTRVKLEKKTQGDVLTIDHHALDKVYRVLVVRKSKSISLDEGEEIKRAPNVKVEIPVSTTHGENRLVREGTQSSVFYKLVDSLVWSQTYPTPTYVGSGRAK